MKTKIVLKRIYHRDRWRIAMFFDFDKELSSRVKSIHGITYSSTNKCFYVDDTEENLKLVFKTLQDHADIDISAIAWKSGEHEKVPDQKEATNIPDISSGDGSTEGDSSEPLKLPETSQVDSGEAEEYQDNSFSTGSGYSPVEFRINDSEGLLIIRFLGKYNREWIREMRTYGKLKFDKKRMEWLLPWSRTACDSLSDYFSASGVKVNIQKQVVNETLKEERKATGDEIRSKSLGAMATDGLEMFEWFLDDNRYSARTRESYLALLGFFFRYFSPREPDTITEEEISKFLYDFIIKLGYSAAYQNQMVSAIKIYYTISGKGKIKPEFFERPRRRRALPKVFSKEEVSQILNSAGNMKHKLVLWIIYSCGLRRSEVTNIKIEDLDRKRAILHIREGKGGVDRIVPVPDKVWIKIDEYISGFKPEVYLFEGKPGGRYSSESVYRLFKDALWKAGIRKDVGVHSLRHSYATHLHENGLDIRYIQELLGHRSTRTTEIYTHVSRRNLIAVRSPIEDLDLK